MSLVLNYISGKKDYFKGILSSVKRSDKKVCYVTFNKSCGFLKEAFKKANIPEDKAYFIDCISAEIKKPDDNSDCHFASAPYELEEIAQNIKEAVGKGYSLVIFDSISNILIYGQAVPSGAEVLSRFIRSFLSSLKRKKGKAVFICSLKDKENPLVQEALGIFDKIKRF
ncbi:hypothetical protein KY358_00105 [Candidatus Woesearchaeota archaeon]|nr:hypothetical protein [Candidatus Woesearchaeota archaeon]